MFNKIKESLKKYFRKIRYKTAELKLYKKFFNKQTDSQKMKKFLKRVANGKYTIKDDIGQTYLDLDDDVFVVDIAIKEEYVRGIELDYEDLVPQINVSYPSVTVLGENFLRNQSFYNKHPIWSAILIAIISSIFTLLISDFFK
ncbi:hypothetical protein [Enterococcus hirae]|uniref:hypothetical protein n=1 Tax=Enterococcus hirae TaxID=1354 RepID=UPI0006B203AA|nr:hypothetical protein [Enterococcus hirae]